MSEAQTQPVGLPVTLELDDDIRLAGKLVSLPDGRLQLGSAKLLKQPAADKKVNLRPGTTAMLMLSQDSSTDGSSGDSPVAITAVSSKTITMEFLEPNNDAARRCRQAIADSSPAGTDAEQSLEFPDILAALKKQSLGQMEKQLKPFLSELADHLFDLSTQIRHSSSAQNIYYDATIAIRRNAAAINETVIKQLEDLYLDLTPAGKDTTGLENQATDEDHLNLVDTTEFESSLAIDRMIARGEEIYHVPLEALLIRLATLIDAEPTKVRVPVHVAPLSRVFQRAITSQNYPPPVLLAVFDFFTREFMHDLERYYVSLNELLARRGIKPGLEQEIESKGTLLRKDKPARKTPPKTKTKPKAAPPKEQPPAQQTPQIPPSPSRQTPPANSPGATAGGGVDGGAAETPGAEQQEIGTPSGAGQRAKYDNIYKSVIDALNFRRESDGMATPGSHGGETALAGTWQGSTVESAGMNHQKLANAQSIAQALGSLQRDAKARAEVEQGTSLREYLASNKDQLGDLKNTEGLTADSLNQLDLVDNLFGTIKSQLDVTAELKPALGELHIPLAKLALLDPHFFLDRGHPARATVDKLSQLATSANFPNKALEGRITEIVDDIVADYDSDNSVFETAVQKIDKLLAQQERALTRNVERVVRIQEGQEKLHKAQRAVDKAVGTRIKPPKAPKVLVDLVDNGWRDLMVLTHIKEGPTSRGWKDNLKTLDLLGTWLSEQDHGEVDEDLLMQRGLEAGTLIDMIGQQITTAVPTSISHQDVLEELREILAGNRQVEFTEIEDTSAEAPATAAQVRAKIDDLPRLRRWVKRVEQLEKDIWLTYRGKDGLKRRMQLAWISEERDRYIFVNERGQKVADLSSTQLARQLSRGMQPPAPADKLTVVDQSLYQTLEHVQKTLSFARNHDSLTKLINREVFEDQMNRALRHAQQKHSQHALLYLNIDQFSLVNEVYDRNHGDQVLLEFATLLSQLHGKKTSSARLESDNFVVLLLDRSMEQAMAIAEKIRHDIEISSVDIDGENISFTVSIGVAPVHEYSPEVGKIIDDARTTTYHAKEQGRNRVLQFEQDQAVAKEYLRDKMQVKKDLEQAVASDRFVLRAQPIVQTEVKTGAAVSLHYELLLGLVDKNGAVTSPEEFINSAERYGFMTLVDRWVVREAFSWISELMDAQKVVPRLSINLSGSAVTDDGFMEYLFEQISEFGVGTSRVCFEITETGTISNLVKAADFVRAFRNIGCKFSIDDFGTGLASHNYLRELPVDYVKIDGSFVTKIHKNRNDYAIARSINDLAHFLGQETIAESVENNEIIEKLQEIGVDYLQGWGVGRPQLLTDVAKDLSPIEK